VTRARARVVDHRTRVGRERRARTEERILSAALGVFADQGPDAPVIDDFIQAAGIARGTFYNHFQSVEALLQATSARTTRQVVETIEEALKGLPTPTQRLGVGLRLFFSHAQRQPVWCRFVARVWSLGGLELPTRDLEEGVRLGQFRVPGREAAQDLLLGTVRETLRRIGEGASPVGFGDQVVALVLRALQAPPAEVAAVLARPLPALPEGAGGL
jgi:AcrR family transcriptional regulator